MFRRFSTNMAVLSILLDGLLTLLAFWVAALIRPYLPDFPFLVPVSSADFLEFPLYLYLVVPLLWNAIFILNSVYDPRRIYKVVDELQNVTLATGVAALVFAGFLYLFVRDFSRYLLITFVALDLLLLLSWRLLLRPALQVIRRPESVRRVLIVGAGEVGQQVGELLDHLAWTGLKLVGYLDDDPEKRGNGLPVLGGLEETYAIVQAQDIDDVVIALPQRAYGQINKLVIALHQLPVQVRIVPDYFSLALYRATVDDFGGLPMINLRDPALNEVQRMTKRLFDLVVGSTLTLLALPFMIMIAIALKLDSPGPVFFRQERVGENGKPFTMYKFRSMVDGADALRQQITQMMPDGRLFYKMPGDPRVTRVGYLLRRTSLDELPQLFNVLKGEMSLVGPRPELPWLLEHYQPWQHKRFAVPQGMTGWWQVNGRADKPMHLHTEEDLYYVQNYSLWMDIYILLKTLWVVMRGNGAY